MTNINKRLGDLENQLNSGVCSCGNIRVIYPEDEQETKPEPGPEICPNCGKERITIVVIRDDDPKM